MATLDPPKVTLEEGKQALEASRLDDALQTFRSIADADPVNAAAFYYHGMTLKQLEKPGEAIAPLQRAVELAPDQTDYWLELGDAQVSKGDFSDAAQSFTRATTLSPDNASAWLWLAIALGRGGQPGPADQAFEKAFTLDPSIADRPTMLSMRAEMVRSLGRRADALALVERALANVAEDEVDRRTDLLLHKGTDLNELGRPADALAAFDEAAAIVQNDSVRGAIEINRGVTLNALGRHDEAIAALDSAIPRLSGDDERSLALFHQGLALTQLGKFEPALTALQQAGAMAPPESWLPGRIRLQQGMALNALSRHEEAARVLNEALAVLPADGPFAVFRSGAWLQLGQAQLARSQPADALISVEHAIDLTRDDQSEIAVSVRPTAMFFKGIALNALGRYQEALDVLVSAEPGIGQSPFAAVSWFQTGIALNALGQHDAALAQLDRALAAPPAAATLQVLPAIWFQRAVALSGLKRFDDALAAFDELAKIAPPLAASVPVWMVRTGVLLELGKVDGMLDAPPALADHPFVLAYQGSVLFMLRGDMAGAMQLFAKAQRPGPTDPWPALGWFGYAMCAQSLNRPAEALEAFDRAGELDASLTRSPAHRLLRGQTLNMLDRHEEALNALDGAPDNEATWVTRGIALAALKRDEEALRAFDQALARAKETGIDRPLGAVYATAAAVQKGLLLLRAGRSAEALESFDVAVAASESRPPDDVNRVLALLGKGLALSRLERPREAEGFLTSAAQASRGLLPSFPYRGLAWLSLGSFLADQSRQDEAINAFDKSLELEKNSVSAFIGRANAHLRLEDFERAEADFAAAMKHATENEAQDRFDALVGLGQAQSGQGRYDDAIITFRQGLAARSPKLRPSTNLWLGLGGAYQGLGRTQAALRAFQNGWHQDARPKRSREVALGVSAVLLDLNRDEEALKFLQEARARTRADERLDFNLGIAHYRLKQKDKAREAWQRASKAGLQTADAALEELSPLRQTAAGWLDYWFGEGRGVGRKFTGGALLVMLGFTLIAPLINPGAIPLLNTGKDWSVTVSTVVVLTVLLLFHAIGKFSVGKDSLEVLPAQPAAGSGGTGMDSVLGRLQAIGPALAPTFTPENVSGNLGSGDAVAGASGLAGHSQMMTTPTVAPAAAPR